MKLARLVPAVLLVTVLGGAAIAQPGATPPSAPGTAPAPPPAPPAPPPPPGDPNAGAPAPYQPQPYPPQPYPPQPQPYPPQPSPYAQPPYQPGYPYPQPLGPVHDGLTVGVDLGLGLTNGEPDSGNGSTETGLSGVNLTLGGFMNPKLAIALRVSSTTFWVDDGFGGPSLQLTNAFVGGVVQYWATPQFFVGGGAGVGVFAAFFEDQNDSVNGFAVNGRAGYEFSQSASSGFHVALELTPSFYSENGSSVRITSIAFQVGWQHY